MARKKTSAGSAKAETKKSNSAFKLQVELGQGALDSSKTLVIFASQTEKKSSKGTAKAADSKSATTGLQYSAPKAVSRDAIGQIHAEGLFSGKLGETFFARNFNHGTKSLLLVGVGSTGPITHESLRRAAAYAHKALAAQKVSDAIVDLNSASALLKNPEDVGRALAEGFLLTSYKFTELKSEENKPEALQKRNPKHITIWSEGAKKPAKALEEGFKLGTILAEATNFARRLGDMPGNLMTPSILADHAKIAAEGNSLKVTVWDKARILKENMGMFYGVSQGSSEEPRFIIMEYKGGAAGKKPLCFVGKGLTFDCGGTSIKPSAGMEEMKYDMCGGAAIIGVMHAIARLKLKINVVGLVPSTENLVGPSATKPGDVHTARNGKTVEINNTDAEGRLILGDALCYASELEPVMCVDTATLTGAIKIALGDHHTGYFSRDKALTKKIEEAAGGSGEPLWEMPLNDEHTRDMRGTYADLSNISSPGGGAGSAKGAAFLSEFIAKGIPWAHFDIAATAWNTGRLAPYNPDKGASGVIVRTFVELARNWK